MPIFSYFAVVGTALVALLFFADANLEKRGPLAISTNFEGLPKPWKPELNPPLPPAKPPEIQAKAAPSLDPSFNTAPTTTVAQAPPEQPPVQHTAKAEPAPKKQKHAARKQPPRRDDRERYAWRHDNGWFGGNSNPWRF